VTNLSLPAMADLLGRQRPLSIKSVKLNIMMSSALGYSPTNFGIKVPGSGLNRL